MVTSDIKVSPNLANAMVKLVAADALPALMGNLLMGNLVKRDFEPVVGQHGDKVSIPVPGVGQEGPITLNTHAEATFEIADITKALAFPELLKAYMQAAVSAIAARIESDLLSLYGQFTANAPVGAAGSPVTEATIDAADTALFLAMVPPSAPKCLVVKASTYSQIRQMPRFREYYSSGEAGLRALVDGNVGRLNDFFVFRSQFVPTTGGLSPNNHNLAFTRDAIGLVVRRLPQPLPGTGAIAEYAEMGNFGIRVVMSYQPNCFAQHFTVGLLYGTGALRNSFGVQVYS